ncbi:unnamed protein product [Oikopleura dioica]|uniref:Uncharacterized protein n=1 Tax=Oikopleura dioica TaxID=34765 RepID=E4X4E6_OIKDI|nr:unnamed protein product [Oikopleura dioica]
MDHMSFEDFFARIEDSVELGRWDHIDSVYKPTAAVSPVEIGRGATSNAGFSAVSEETSGQSPDEVFNELISMSDPVTGNNVDDLNCALIRDALTAFSRPALVAKLFAEALITIPMESLVTAIDACSTTEDYLKVGYEIITCWYVVTTAYNPAQATNVYEIAQFFCNRLAEPTFDHEDIKRYLRGLILCTKGILQCIRVMATKKEFTVEELKQVHAVQNLLSTSSSLFGGHPTQGQQFRNYVTTLNKIRWTSIHPTTHFVHILRCIFSRVQDVETSGLDERIEQLPSETAKLLFGLKLLRANRRVAFKGNDLLDALSILEYRYKLEMHNRDSKNICPPKKICTQTSNRTVKMLPTLTEVRRDRDLRRRVNEKRAPPSPRIVASTTASSSATRRFWMGAQFGGKYYWCDLVAIGQHEELATELTAHLSGPENKKTEKTSKKRTHSDASLISLSDNVQPMPQRPYVENERPPTIIGDSASDCAASDQHRKILDWAIRRANPTAAEGKANSGTFRQPAVPRLASVTSAPLTVLDEQDEDNDVFDETEVTDINEAYTGPRTRSAKRKMGESDNNRGATANTPQNPSNGSSSAAGSSSGGSEYRPPSGSDNDDPPPQEPLGDNAARFHHGNIANNLLPRTRINQTGLSKRTGRRHAHSSGLGFVEDSFSVIPFFQNEAPQAAAFQPVNKRMWQTSTQKPCELTLLQQL